VGERTGGGVRKRASGMQVVTAHFGKNGTEVNECTEVAERNDGNGENVLENVRKRK